MDRATVYESIGKHFFHSYQSMVFDANRYLGKREDAEEAIMEAYTDALEHWHMFYAEEEDLHTWLMRFVEKWAKRIRSEREMQGMVLDSVPNNVEQLIESESNRNQVILSMYFLQKRKRKWIAQALHMKDATISQIIQRFKTKHGLNNLPTKGEDVFATPKDGYHMNPERLLMTKERKRGNSRRS